MMNFKKSKMAKVVSGFIGLSMSVMMLPGVASAAFMADLTVGSKGADVSALQQVLVSAGHLTMPAGVAMGYFGNLTKMAVAAWQKAAGISPAAGYVGPKSRAALNAMGSGSTAMSYPAGCTSAVGFSSTTGASCATVTTTPAPTTTVSTVPGCTSTMGFSPTTGAACSGATATVAAGSGVSVMLDASVATPKLIVSQGVGTLAGFKISNGGSSALKVTMMKFKRVGYSSDSTLNNVYLYQGGTRLTDSASVASGVVNFTDAAGLVTVPAMGSVTVLVRADIGTTGSSVGVQLTDMLADGVTVSGLPLSGLELDIVSAPSGMTTADFTGTFSPASGSIDPQSDYVVWQKNLNISSRDANLTAFRLQQIGSVYQSDIKNFRLMVDGVQVGAAVDMADANRFVTFTASPAFVMKTGSHVVKVVADVIGGSNRNFEFSLRRVVDVEILDSQFGVVVTPTVGSATFAAIDSAATTISINSGTITITKTTDSPSGNVTNNASGITLGKFTVKANGEKLKVESLRVSHTASEPNFNKIRNGGLFLNGVQIGSTADICEDSNSAASCDLVTTVYATKFNLGSSMILEPGQSYTLEVRGDVYNVNSADALASGTTTVVNIEAGSSNIYRMGSLSYFNNTQTVGNTLTVASGSLTLSKYTAYANQTIITPQTAFKIGEWRLTGGSSEGVNIDTITLTLAGDLAATTTDITNLYVVYGSKTSTTKASGAASQSWSINEALPANGTMNVAVYANLSSAAVAGKFTAGTLVMSGTSATAGSAVTSTAAGVAGQTITVGAGTLTVAADASTPIAANVVALSMPKVLSMKYTSSNDAFTLTDIGVTVGSAANAAAISELVFKDGATELKRVSMNGAAATATGLTVAVPKDGSKIIDVYANLGAVGSGFATTSLNVATSHASTKYLTSAGVTTYKNSAFSGTAQYVMKTKPTITTLILPTSVLSSGTVTVAKFRISADAGGTVAWRKLILTIASSTGITVAGNSSWGIYDDANQASVLTGTSALTNAASTTVTFTSSGDQEIPAGGYKDYVVKTVIGGAVLTTGMNFQTSIAAGQTAAVALSTYGGYTQAAALVPTATFVWSDESASGHAAETGDWMGDWLVKNLPTDTQTLTK